MTPSAPARLRLFVALDLPAPVRTGLAAWTAEQLGAVAAVRRLAPGSMHVTLCFLGGQEAAEAPAIAAAVRSAVGVGSAVRLALGDPLWLPRRRPRVCAVSLVDVDGALATLQSTVAQALQRGGWYAPERRRFLAHVTVGRVGRVGRDGPSRPEQPPGPPAIAFAGEAVVLYRSHSGSGGARYEPLKTIALAD